MGTYPIERKLLERLDVKWVVNNYPEHYHAIIWERYVKESSNQLGLVIEKTTGENRIEITKSTYYQGLV